MVEQSGERVTKERVKGVKTKLFGVILIFLGGLDAMLSWRGNFEVSQFYWALLGAGAFLVFLGSARQQSARRNTTAPIVGGLSDDH